MGCGQEGFGGSSGPNVPAWSLCIDFFYTDFTGFAALTGNIQIHSLLARGLIQGAVIKTVTAFAGPGITTLNLSLGLAGDLAKYLSPYNGLAAVSDTNFGYADELQLENFGAATSIRLAATAIGANLSALTQGAGCLYLSLAQLPVP
jgi:hypothetical protein